MLCVCGYGHSDGVVAQRYVERIGPACSWRSASTDWAQAPPPASETDRIAIARRDPFWQWPLLVLRLCVAAVPIGVTALAAVLLAPGPLMEAQASGGCAPTAHFLVLRVSATGATLVVHLLLGLAGILRWHDQARIAFDAAYSRMARLFSIALPACLFMYQPLHIHMRTDTSVPHTYSFIPPLSDAPGSTLRCWSSCESPRRRS